LLGQEPLVRYPIRGGYEVRICVIRNRVKTNERTQKNAEELFVATDGLYLIIFTPTAENPDHDSFMGSLPENTA
jgi:hypothetical protein